MLLPGQLADNSALLEAVIAFDEYCPTHAHRHSSILGCYPCVFLITRISCRSYSSALNMRHDKPLLKLPATPGEERIPDPTSRKKHSGSSLDCRCPVRAEAHGYK